MKRTNKKNKLSFNKVFGDIREKISKIIYCKIKENPAIKQAEIMIQGEMKMAEKIIKEAKPKKVPDLHPELKKFIAEQNERWNEQNKKWEAQTELNQEIKEFIKDQNRRWNEQNKKWEEQNQKWNGQMEFNQQMQKTNQVVLTSIQEILLRLERIENLPTIKKELVN